MRIIDLSIPLDTEVKDPLPLSIRYENHEESAERMSTTLFGLKASDFPEGKGLAGEFLTITSHSGTHVDAPYHYWPTSEGKPAKTIDQLPLEWFFSDGVVLDFTDKPPGYAIQVSDLIEKLDQIGYQLKPFDIVLIRSDADKKMYDDDYADCHVGVSAEATHWLIDQGIKVMGTDGWGWDISLKLQAEQYKQNPRDGILWAAHFVGKDKEYCQIEKLANLDQLPKPYGFKFCAFPIKLKNGSGAWTRAVAFVD